jgi:hypothetical protein
MPHSHKSCGHQQGALLPYAGHSPAHGKGLLIRLLPVLLSCLLVLLGPIQPSWAQLHTHLDENGSEVVRSLESLRDLDYQSWQLVAYRTGPARPDAPLTLRVVGYPGKVRLDHPTALQVSAGRRHWELADITTANPKLAADSRDAAAEFDLKPLINDLANDRPLRLALGGVFVELPVPPFVVAEWRSLLEAS